MMKNSLGKEVTRPNDELIVMRGIPGSGKSTKAKQLVGNGIIHSTDDVIEAKYDYKKFFEDMIAAAKRKEENAFAPLHQAHAQNNKNIKNSMKSGVSPVILDNTNIKASEPKEIVEFALNLGYADENIKFVEVGTAGLSAEELAQRNTHGVPLDKIEKMIQSMKSVGPLTLEKVVKAKPMFKKSNILYSAVVLDEASRTKLLGAIGHNIPEDWSVIAHHMTIIFGRGLPKEMKDDVGKTVQLQATDLGISDMAIAVKVRGYTSMNAIPHVTIAINDKAGGKAVMSNDIKNWERLPNYINLSGVVTEIKRK